MQVHVGYYGTGASSCPTTCNVIHFCRRPVSLYTDTPEPNLVAAGGEARPIRCLGRMLQALCGWRGARARVRVSGMLRSHRQHCTCVSVAVSPSPLSAHGLQYNSNDEPRRYDSSTGLYGRLLVNSNYSQKASLRTP